MKTRNIIITEARKAEYDRAYKAACKMYEMSLSFLESVLSSAKDYDLTEQDIREVILSPILLLILNRRGLTSEEKKALMEQMLSQVCDMYENVIGPFDDEEE